MANFFDTLWKRLTGTNKTRGNAGKAQGNIYPLGHYQKTARKQGLEISYQPVRPIKNSFQNSRELIEMSEWSYELRHSISILSRDCFQTLDGNINSWRVKEDYEGVKVNPDIIAISKDIATRTRGKDLILGGNFLQKAVRDFLFFGDSFVSLGFEKDGISNKFKLNQSLYLPTLSTFVDLDDDNEIASYSQRESINLKKTDECINPLKILHFSYERDAIYGTPISFQSLEAWRQLKDISLDLEQAARDTGYSLLAHKFPESVTTDDRDTYQSRYESMLNSGIVTNLYLLPGMEVERIAVNAGSLEPLMKLWLQKRYECIPPGLPLYLFPGLGIEATAGKEISNQPAMNYSRLISSSRGILSERIKWAISLEIIFTKGYDFFYENRNFDIVWGDWFITGMEQGVMQQDSQKSGK